MEYLRFVAAHRHFLGFGLTMMAFSSFGQTYYISLFGAELRETFDLSHGELGLIYSAATLLSGITMLWLGRAVDLVALKPLCIWVTLGLAAACLGMAFVPAAFVLFGVFFLLRLGGQGMMSHTALSGAARFFGPDRGKAVGIVALGSHMGAGLSPLLAVAVIGAIGWRQSWAASAGLLVLVVLPLLLWLLSRSGATVDREIPHAAGDTARQWSRAEVLRDRRFYLIAPAVAASSFIITGLFFHHPYIAELKGWTLTWLASCFLGYAVATVLAALAVGALVDRFGARRLLPYYLAPLALTMAVLVSADAPIVALVYLLLAGIAVGSSQTVVNAIWAEVYGVRHLGAIRALAFSLNIVASALSPFSMGWLFDRGVSLEAIVAGCIVYVVAVSLLLGFAMPKS
jgi:MFS family permease